MSLYTGRMPALAEVPEHISIEFCEFVPRPCSLLGEMGSQ